MHPPTGGPSQDRPWDRARLDSFHGLKLEQLIDQAIQEASAPTGLSKETALLLMDIEAPERIHLLMARANELRHRQCGDEVELCAIINARSGRCSEDCAFCAQSVHHQARVDTYALMETDQILRAAAAARDRGVGRFSIVTSGKSASGPKDLERIVRTLEGIKKLGLSPCASLGLLTRETAEVLVQAGLETYHHNLETSPGFYPSICSTHSIDERIETCRTVKSAGLRLCCGGIFGLGESREDRIALALTIKDLAPESVPLNFLSPIAGTPLEHAPRLSPMEILKTIAVFRMIMPDMNIRTCGGRESNLRGLQALMFLAGANGTMVGNYLTTSGRSPAEDIQDIKDLGLKIRSRP